MGIIQQSIDRLLGVAPPVTTKTAESAPMREAAGTTVDKDDHLWRLLSGRSEKDLEPMNQARAVKQAKFLWESNVLANRITELPIGYLLSKGLKLKVGDDEDSQKILDRHWNDSINAWPIKLVKRVRELSLFGEQCWPVFVGGNGFVRVGYLDPALIETVVMDPDNAEQPIGVVTRKDAKGRARRYKVIINAGEDVFAASAQSIRETFTDGQCFLFRVNDLCNGSRGRPDMLASMDWLDAYEHFLFGELDRADFMRAFFWDVELTGSDQTAVEQRARQITAPRSGSVRVHNENEKWTAIAPELNSADSEQASKLLRNHILGGNTMPEHWYGGAGDVNRATGSSMVEPTEKMYEMRQIYLGYMLCEVGRFVLRAHWKLLEDYTIPEDKQKILDTLEVEWPEMTTKDTTRYAAAFAQLMAAGVQAIQEGVLTRETVLRILATVTKQLGLEIDVEAELEKAAEELAAAGGKDLFKEPLVDEVPIIEKDPGSPAADEP